MKQEYISTDRGRKICGTCDHYKFESVDFGFMCTSAYSDESGQWVEYEDSCECWESESDDEEQNYIVMTDRHITRLIYESEDEE